MLRKKRSLQARRGVGVDHLGAEGRGEVHAALEDLDGVFPPQVDMGREGVAL